jgi:hypothetical protein
MTHPHLVSEPFPASAGVACKSQGTWLRIVHCTIFRAVTLPEAINLATSRFRQRGLVSEALGVPRNLRVSPAEAD